MPSPAPPRVVITGMGAVSPAGNCVADFWASLSAGRDCIAPITRFDASPYRSQLAGEVTGFPLPDSETSRASAYALAAIEQAIADAGLGGEPLREAGLSLATNFGGCEHGTRALAARLGGDDPDPAWFDRYSFGAAASAVGGS